MVYTCIGIGDELPAIVWIAAFFIYLFNYLFIPASTFIFARVTGGKE